MSKKESYTHMIKPLVESFIEALVQKMFYFFVIPSYFSTMKKVTHLKLFKCVLGIKRQHVFNSSTSS